jgi:hypothetical protein
MQDNLKYREEELLLELPQLSMKEETFMLNKELLVIKE